MYQVWSRYGASRSAQPRFLVAHAPGVGTDRRARARDRRRELAARDGHASARLDTGLRRGGKEQPLKSEWNLGGYANHAVQRVRSPLRDGDPLLSGYRRRFTVTVNAALAVLALVSVPSQRTLVR